MGPRSLPVVALSLLLVTMAAQSLPAQSDAPAYRLRVQSVMVDVTVTDRSGKAAPGLTADDFEVFEDGQPRPLTSFAEHSLRAAGPMQASAGAYDGAAAPSEPDGANILLLDSLNTPLEDQQRLRRQILEYLLQAQPGTPLAIFSLSSQLRMIEGFTDDPAALRAGLMAKGIVQASQLLPSTTSAAASQQSADQLKTFTAGDARSQATTQALINFLSEQTRARLARVLR